MALAPRTFPVGTHVLSEVLWAYLCSVGYAGANTKIFALAPRTFPVDTHDLSEVLWAYLCSVGYTGANTNIWH